MEIPIGREDATFFFALPRCPIALAAAASYERVTGSGHADARYMARNAMLDAEDAGAVAWLDDVVSWLQDNDGDDRASGREHMDELLRTMRGPSRRPDESPRRGSRNPVFWAFASTVGLLCLLWAVAALKGEGHPIGLTESSAMVDVELVVVSEDSGAIAFDVRVDGAVFVSCWFVAQDGGPIRLFPPLSKPRDLPWPLVGRPRTGYRIPAHPFHLRTPEQDGFLVVLANDEMVPDWPLPRRRIDDIDVLRNELRGAYVFAWPDAGKSR